jgi:hypothetical protein
MRQGANPAFECPLRSYWRIKLPERTLTHIFARIEQIRELDCSL